MTAVAGGVVSGTVLPTMDEALGSNPTSGAEDREGEGAGQEDRKRKGETRMRREEKGGRRECLKSKA